MATLTPRSFARVIGGAIAAPRQLMGEILTGAPGGLNEVLLLLGFQVLALQLPELVRAAWFMATVDPRGGLSMLINAVSQPLVMPLVAALAGSVLLGWLRGGGSTNGRSLDLAALAVAPYLVLQLLGAVVFKVLGPLGLGPLAVQAGVTLAGGGWFVASLALAVKTVRAGEGADEQIAKSAKQKAKSGRVSAAGWGAAGLVLLVLGVNTVLVMLNPAALKPVAQGSLAPALDLSDLEGKQVTLQSLRGEVVLISFWASWCSPCMREMPFLAGLQQELGPHGLQVLAVNVEGSPGLVRQVLERQEEGPGLKDLRVLVDDGRTSARFGVRTLPHLVLLDRSGTVSHVQVGSGGEAKIRARAAAALGSGSGSGSTRGPGL